MATILCKPIQHFGLILYGILLQYLCGILLVSIGPTTGCSLPPGWGSKNIKQRMRQATAEIVIKGEILTDFPTENIPTNGGDVYSARIQVLCVYKGPIVAERVTVTGFGRNADCVDTNVKVGSSYIIIMMPYEDRYQIVEVNQQIAVQGWSSRTGPLIEKDYPCQDPYTLPPTTPIPTTTYPMTTTTEEMTIAMTTTESGRKVSTSLLITTQARTTELEDHEDGVMITARKGMSVREEQPEDPEGGGCKSTSTYSMLFLAFFLLRIVME